MQTINKQRALTERQLLRIERANPDHFRFPRHSDRHERTLPFVEHAPKIKDAVVETVVFVGFVGFVAALVLMPWWLA